MRNSFFAGPGLSCPKKGSHQGMTNAIGESHYTVERSAILKPAVSHSVANDFRPACKVQLFGESCFVGFYSLDADVQLSGDLFVAKPPGG